MIYDGSAIIHVGEAGLEFVDEYGDMRFINFEACGNNATADLPNPKARVCVAQRILTIDFAGRVERTIEFYTRPSTVFVLDSDFAFRRLRFQIEQMGWRVG